MTGGGAPDSHEQGGLSALKLPIALLAVVPIAPALAYLAGLPPAWVFVSGALGVAVLADWVRRSTEQLAEHVGPAVGGLLTISFGSVADLMLQLIMAFRSQLCQTFRHCT